jgi:hypothetical protein
MSSSSRAPSSADVLGPPLRSLPPRPPPPHNLETPPRCCSVAPALSQDSPCPPSRQTPPPLRSRRAQRRSGRNRLGVSASANASASAAASTAASPQVTSASIFAMRRAAGGGALSTSARRCADGAAFEFLTPPPLDVSSRTHTFCPTHSLFVIADAIAVAQGAPP